MSESPIELSRLLTIDSIRGSEGKLIDDLQIKIAANVQGSKELAKLIEIRNVGGDCPRCHKPWDFVQYTGMEEGYYIQPCECYPICPHCGEQLYQEFLSGDMDIGKEEKACTKCGWRLMKRNENHLIKQWGKDFRDRYGRMSLLEKWQNRGLKELRERRESEDGSRRKGNYSKR